MIYFAIIVCLLGNDCSVVKTYKENTSKDLLVSIDTFQIIDDIRKQYAEINSNKTSFKKVKKDIMDKSSEGRDLIAYYKKDELKKIVATYYGETGKSVLEYYFNKNRLFFEFKKDFFYDKPIYIKGFKVTTTHENRYYFYENELLKWINPNGTVSYRSEEYKQESVDLKEELKSIMALL